MGRKALIISGGTGGGQISITDQRFLNDDLEILVELGLLRQDYNSKGEVFYIITRMADSYVRGLQTAEQ